VVGLAVLVYAAFFKQKSNSTPIRLKESETAITISTGEDTDTPAETVSGAAQVINESNPGETIDIERFVKRGKTTIFDFYSEYCPPCRQIGPLLKELDKKRDDIVVLKVDINRPGKTGIDWGSPVTKQYEINSIPHFMIYDSSGDRTDEGRSAYQKIMEMLQREGLLK
jgi:thiol-disulfide isomerase/thioredoxin